MRFIVYDLESFSNYFTATTMELIPRDPNDFSWRDMEDGDLRIFTHENLEELSSYLTFRASRNRLFLIFSNCILLIRR